MVEVMLANQNKAVDVDATSEDQHRILVRLFLLPRKIIELFERTRRTRFRLASSLL
jgi:hypothetical protein